MVKRLVDIVLSASLLLFFSPVLAFAALMIRLTSPGPAIFRQTRVGRDFRPFKIFKLRTMAQGQAGLAYTLGCDPRITPVGRFLREAKIDELPQLWNVLRGEMSLVGPRPVVPAISEEFRGHYEQLLRVRPGLTDPASIKYRRETRLLASVPDDQHYFKRVVTPDKLRISARYLKRANFWTDGATIAMTAAVCCFPALSRIYGLPPSWPTGEESSAERRRKPDAGDDSSIFSYPRAQLEAVAEQSVHGTVLPIISPISPDFVGQSTSIMPN